MTDPAPARVVAGLIADGHRPPGWTPEREAAMLADLPTPPPALTAEQTMRLVIELRAMDLQQGLTEEHGGREVAWYWWRGDIADLLGLGEDALNMAAYVDQFTNGGES